MDIDENEENVVIINNMPKDSFIDYSDDSDSEIIKTHNQIDNTFKKDEQNETQNGESKNKNENESDIIIINDDEDNNDNEKNILIKRIAGMKLDDSKGNNAEDAFVENIRKNIEEIILIDEEQYEDDYLTNKNLNNHSNKENIQKENISINDINRGSQTISGINENNNIIDSKEAKRRKKRQAERNRRFKKRELKRYRKLLEKTKNRFTEESINRAVTNKGDELNDLWQKYANSVKQIMNDIQDLKSQFQDASIIANEKYCQRCINEKRKEMHYIDKYLIRGDRFNNRKEYLKKKRKEYLERKSKTCFNEQNESDIVTSNNNTSSNEEKPQRSKFTWTNNNNH